MQLDDFYRVDERNLFMLNQEDDAQDVHSLHPKVLGYLSDAVASVTKTSRLAQNVALRRPAMFSTIRDVTLSNRHVLNEFFVHATSSTSARLASFEEVQILEMIDVPNQAVVRLKVEALTKERDLRHQVAIHDVLVSKLQAGCDNDVWIETFIEPKMPRRFPAGVSRH